MCKKGEGSARVHGACLGAWQPRGAISTLDAAGAGTHTPVSEMWGECAGVGGATNSATAPCATEWFWLPTLNDMERKTTRERTDEVRRRLSSSRPSSTAIFSLVPVLK